MTIEDFELPIVARLAKELKLEAAQMGRDQARYLVDAYYEVQACRIAAEGRARAGKGKDKPPYPFLDWLVGHLVPIETRIKSLLKAYADAQIVGQWLQSITGIGPVISAGLLAHIDIEKAPTAGHIWRFAGLDPSQKWLGKEKAAVLVKETLGRASGRLDEEDLAMLATAANVQVENLRRRFVNEKGEAVALTAANAVKAVAKRPWSADLKVLCWKIGESFVKVSNHEDDFYGHLLMERKAYEVQRNEAGELADQAAHKLATCRIDKSTEAYKWYTQGKLPPGHIHARAKRWAVKLFLSHLHQIWYQVHFGAMPPKPYPETILGHTGTIRPPNWPMAEKILDNEAHTQ